MEVILGEYRDTESGAVYTVIERTEEIVEGPVTEISDVIDSISNYMTACGRHLEPITDDLKAFTFDEFDGEIHKIED